MQKLIDIDALADAMEGWSRDHWQPMARQLQEAAVALGEALEPDWERWRVGMMMPHLTMQEVLVHGYVPHKEA